MDISTCISSINNNNTYQRTMNPPDPRKMPIHCNFLCSIVLIPSTWIHNNSSQMKTIPDIQVPSNLIITKQIYDFSVARLDCWPICGQSPVAIETRFPNCPKRMANEKVAVSPSGNQSGRHKTNAIKLWIQCETETRFSVTAPCLLPMPSTGLTFWCQTIAAIIVLTPFFISFACADTEEKGLSFYCQFEYNRKLSWKHWLVSFLESCLCGVYLHIAVDARLSNSLLGYFQLQ